MNHSLDQHPPRISTKILCAAALFGALSTAHADQYADTLAAVKQAVSKGKLVVYQFDENSPIPSAPQNEPGKALKQPGWLVVLNNASNSRNDVNLSYALLPDLHQGPEKRCEDNPKAIASDGTRETAELYTPVEAWGALSKPSVIFNANYFDVRDQGSSTTWQSNKCSVPLGIYFDNHPVTATRNDAITGDKYFAGPKVYLDKNGKSSIVDAFFIADGSAQPGRTDVTYNLVAGDKNATAIVDNANNLIKSGQQFVAFSGTALIPFYTRDDVTANQPDAGTSATTRIGIAYLKGTDQLMIFEGGSYRKGITRAELAGIFNAFGAQSALELDGGGSAAVAVTKGAASWAGTSTTEPAGACPGNGLICSAITQPSGDPRPVPSWASFHF
ncbi:hypothetical protein WS62_06220 [Burkholderia sp. ABCPW 14]|nr:hypothetical protein WS62_06220 [Burkholderia sp. ABCPW 14]